MISIPKIVTHKPIKQLSFKDYEVEAESNKSDKVVDLKGNPTKLSSYQKNAIYRKAKELRENIKSGLCTKSECWNPSEHNIQKMLKKEFPMSKAIESYRNHMRAIGADPRDISTERMRKGR